MTLKSIFRMSPILLILALAGCGMVPLVPQSTSIPSTRTPLSQLDAIARVNDVAATQTAAGVNAVRMCDFIPGKSVPAQIAADVLVDKSPTPELPDDPLTNSPIDAAITNAQLAVYQQIWDEINTSYLFPDFKGKNWKAIGQKYKDMVQKGLKQDDFYQAMNKMLVDLDGGLSRLETPTEVFEEDNQPVYYGIGISILSLNAGGQPKVVIAAVYPGGAAEKSRLEEA